MGAYRAGRHAAGRYNLIRRIRMIRIVAAMKVKPECVDTFKALAKDLVEKSRAEEGNISYSLHEQLGDPCTLAFIESWKDMDAIKIHNKTEHFTSTLPKLSELCESAEPVKLFNEIEL